MKLGDRVTRLEKRIETLDFLSGDLSYQPQSILINGVEYRAVEDIPEDIRKSVGSVTVGKIIKNGDIVAEILA